MACASCGVETPSGAKFCPECGTPLALACGSCGAPHVPGQRFCAECGAPLDAPVAVAPPTPASERRLVSVLFADLVGFTAASEKRGDRELAADGLESAAALFRELGVPFWLGVTLLEHGELLAASGEAEPLLTEAEELFERLGARPWLERLEQVRETLVAAAT